MSAAIIIWTAALALLAINIWFRRQRGARAQLSARAIGREKIKPRPVMENASEVLVKVEFDGTVRELTEEEKEAVDTPFHPFDGNRPYIKSSYGEKNGWGRLNGYLLRKDVPQGMTINPPRIIPQPLDGGRRFW